ncbi:MAG: energy transducer TonB [Verrucomicrobiota bacterium]|jgi:hypothetical protein
MEEIVHTRHARKKRNTTRANLTLSIILHAVAFIGIFFWASYEGMLGNRMRELTVSLVPGEKKPKTEKTEEAKAALLKPLEQPRQDSEARSAAPKLNVPPPADVPAAAPPPTEAPVIIFGDSSAGSADPIESYRVMVQNALQLNWHRPPDTADLDHVAEAELTVGPNGEFVQHELVKQSGDKSWDDSVLQALAETKSVNRKPPPGFPPKFLVRFDAIPAPEPLLQ